jgi:hypothetical protein
MALNLTRKGGSSDRREEDLRNTVMPLHSKEEFVKEITRLWGEANQKFIAIGRYLIMAKQSLPHGEYQPMIERDLPFRPATARMIVTATQAIVNNLLPADRLPPNYSTVYLLTTLSQEERAEAERNGLIRPNVRREEIVSFKRALAASRVSDVDRMRAEREKLLADRRRIDARLAEIESSIGGVIIDLKAEEV